MKVKDLIAYLEQFDGDKEIAICLWRQNGLTTYSIPHTPHGKKEFTGSDGVKYVRIAWIDDCEANIIQE